MREEMKRRRKNSKTRRLFIRVLLVALIGMVGGGGYYLTHRDQLIAENYNRGESFLLKGDYEAAATTFHELYQHHPDSRQAPQALFQSAEIRNLYQSRYQKALLDYLLVERDYPESPQALKAERQIAEIYKNRLRDYPQAIFAYQKLLDKGPPDSDKIQYEVADSYFRLNNFEQARIEFESLLKAYPHSKLVPEVRYRIAVASSLVGQPKAAEEEFRSVIKDFPGDPYALESRFSLAGVLEDQGKLGEALKGLEDLKGVYPDKDALIRRITQVKRRIDKKGEGF